MSNEDAVLTGGARRLRARAAMLAGIALLVAPAPPALATHTPPTRVQVEQYAPLPCTIACPNMDTGATVFGDVCNASGPAGSVDKTVFEITDPTHPVVIETQPDVDYDSFVCTDTEPSVLVTPLVVEWCCPMWLPGPVDVYLGCPEVADVSLEQVHRFNGGANDRFVLVSYNWSDPSPLPVRINGAVRVVDDSYGPPTLPSVPMTGLDGGTGWLPHEDRDDGTPAAGAACITSATLTGRRGVVTRAQRRAQRGVATGRPLRRA